MTPVTWWAGTRFKEKDEDEDDDNEEDEDDDNNGENRAPFLEYAKNIVTKT